MCMITIIQSDAFAQWYKRLDDVHAKRRIDARIFRMEHGNLGDVQSVGEGVHEARIHVNKGYRLYFINRDQEIIVLLCGGDKSTQPRDIALAKEMAKVWRH
jgi:putative addiction module killer protein